MLIPALYMLGCRGGPAQVLAEDILVRPVRQPRSSPAHRYRKIAARTFENHRHGCLPRCYICTLYAPQTEGVVVINPLLSTDGSGHTGREGSGTYGANDQRSPAGFGHTKQRVMCVHIITPPSPMITLTARGEAGQDATSRPDLHCAIMCWPFIHRSSEQRYDRAVALAAAGGWDCCLCTEYK
jgi:hypothetical protein